MTGSGLRTPRAAAIAGILFALLLGLAFALILISQPADPSKPGSWLSDPARRRAVAVALNLVPFAGIAFLWFIGVVRDRLGTLEDRFFATVFLGSGLLFVAMLFVASAIGAALVANAGTTAATGTTSAPFAFARQVSTILIHTYALRMAGVFTMSTATILLRTRVVPRWIAILGLAVALVLLLAVGLSPWLELLFPAWIGLLSAAILWATMRRGGAPAALAG